MDDAPHLDEAIALARLALADDVGGPFGAVVVRDGRVVGRGRNRVLSSRDPTAHAEVVALREACATLGTHVLGGCVVYASSEPCPMCLAACYWARVDAVVFAASRDEAAATGFDDAFLYEDLARPAGDRALPLHHRPRAEAREVLRTWAAREGRRLY